MSTLVPNITIQNCASGEFLPDATAKSLIGYGVTPRAYKLIRLFVNNPKGLLAPIMIDFDNGFPNPLTLDPAILTNVLPAIIDFPNMPDAGKIFVFGGGGDVMNYQLFW